jgi:hypothetical protein
MASYPPIDAQLKKVFALTEGQCISLWLRHCHSAAKKLAGLFLANFMKYDGGAGAEARATSTPA